MNRDLIDIYLDGDQWCAIYPMGSNLMECEAVEFSPIRKAWCDMGLSGRMRDVGRWDALEKLKDNHSIPTDSFHCEYWD